VGERRGGIVGREEPRPDDHEPEQAGDRQAEIEQAGRAGGADQRVHRSSSVLYRLVRSAADPTACHYNIGKLRSGCSPDIGQTVNKGAVTSMAAGTPTIVFVHGAWADASGFGGVIRALGERGHGASGSATRFAT
jgi:hypothetical protein